MPLKTIKVDYLGELGKVKAGFHALLYGFKFDGIKLYFYYKIKSRVPLLHLWVVTLLNNYTFLLYANRMKYLIASIITTINVTNAISPTIKKKPLTTGIIPTNFPL